MIQMKCKTYKIASFLFLVATIVLSVFLANKEQKKHSNKEDVEKFNKNIAQLNQHYVQRMKGLSEAYVRTQQRLEALSEWFDYDSANFEKPINTKLHGQDSLYAIVNDDRMWYSYVENYNDIIKQRFNGDPRSYIAIKYPTKSVFEQANKKIESKIQESLKQIDDEYGSLHLRFRV